MFSSAMWNEEKKSHNYHKMSQLTSRWCFCSLQLIMYLQEFQEVGHFVYPLVQHTCVYKTHITSKYAATGSFESKYIMLNDCISHMKSYIATIPHHPKTHTLPLSVRFQHIPPGILQSSATWKTQIRHFSVRSQEGQQQKYLKIYVPLHQRFFGITPIEEITVSMIRTSQRPFY